MYLRFVVARVDRATGTEEGFFGTATDIKYKDLPAPEWIVSEVTREIAWFNQHLAPPARMQRSVGRRGPVRGVCWFRPAAVSGISRARYVAWLLTEAGYPVRHHKRYDPGEIIWRDDLQVVACPDRNLPSLFR